MDNINTNLHTIRGGSITEKELDKTGYQLLYHTDEYYQKYRDQWHNNPKKFVVSNFPLFLDIEATSACNLKCPHCVQTHANFKKGYMKWDLYKKVIDEASEEGCYGCKYHTISRGEPMLNQNLVRMVQYAKKKGLVDVYLNTNATLLREDISRGLLDAGLDRISFSIDGNFIDYNQVRIGADFVRVKIAVEEFYELRQKGDYDCDIRIQTVDLPEVDFDEYGGFWISMADEVSMIDFKDMTKRETGLKGKWICPQPWQRMSVLFDGTILPCNHDDRMLAALGNVKKTSIGKVWNSNAMKFFREEHKFNNAHLLSACDGCFLRSSEINKEK